MHLEPGCADAAAEQREITRIGRAVLTRIGFSDVGAGLMCHPGLISVVNEVQRLPREVSAAQRSAVESAARAALATATSSAQRAREFDCPAWAVDLPPAEPYLCASLNRALAQIPARTDRVIDVRVAEWSDAERAVFCASTALLARAWPQMLAELAVCVRQVTLLRGYGITGFSDFAVQGAIFVNAERLDMREGLPGALRLAENLVHEGTHTRCYSAAVRKPFLRTRRTDVVVATPLRADPRPLWGLFQQLVVLCRCAELYRRVELSTEFHVAVHARKEKLTAQARRAWQAAHHHSDQLTDHGLAILSEAAAVIGTETSPAG